MQDGRVTAITIVGEDISARKAAEERGRQASRLEAIGQVAGALAHDFNNLFALMMSQVQLLNDELAPAGAGRESLEELQETLARAGAMTRNLIDAVRQSGPSVSDSGPGIPDSIRARVIEPFFTTKAQGIGFGLSTCHALALAREGALQVSCPDSGGTTISLLLPELETGSERQSATRAVTASVPLTILIVEDNEPLRTNLARSLSRLGHRLLQAHHGAEALELLARHSSTIDVVLSDHAMPQLGGSSFFDQLQSCYPGLPVVVMTGSIGDADRARLEQRGVQVQQKPLAPPTLAAVLHQAAARRPAS